MDDKGDVTCFVPGISVSFQKSYFYYTNYLCPLTMLLSIWCFVANAAVIIGLFRSGIKNLRPGLLFLCSLTLTDLFWGATVAPIDSWFRITNYIEKQRPSCGIDTRTTELPMLLFIVITNLGSILNLAVISIDRYLAVKVPGDPLSRHCRLLCCLGDIHHNWHSSTSRPPVPTAPSSTKTTGLLVWFSHPRSFGTFDCHCPDFNHS